MATRAEQLLPEMLQNVTEHIPAYRNSNDADIEQRAFFLEPMIQEESF